MNLACALRSQRLASDPTFADTHVSTCLRCQAEAVRYRTLVRNLATMRGSVGEAPPGFVSLVRTGLHGEVIPPRPPVGKDAAVAAAGLAAVAGAVALWRRGVSA